MLQGSLYSHMSGFCSQGAVNLEFIVPSFISHSTCLDIISQPLVVQQISMNVMYLEIAIHASLRSVLNLYYDRVKTVDTLMKMLMEPMI